MTISEVGEIIAGIAAALSVPFILYIAYSIGHMRGSCGRCSICKERYAAKERVHE